VRVPVQHHAAMVVMVVVLALIGGGGLCREKRCERGGESACNEVASNGGCHALVVSKGGASTFHSETGLDAFWRGRGPGARGRPRASQCAPLPRAGRGDLELPAVHSSDHAGIQSGHEPSLQAHRARDQPNRRCRRRS
jgi:hypothetical protein